MLEILRFILGGFWEWLGFVIILSLVLNFILDIIMIIIKIVSGIRKNKNIK